jgi:hypothetical protein
VLQNGDDEHGRTPLHVACTRAASSDTLALVRLLLEYHGNPNAVCHGQSPLSLAIALANEPVVDLLLNHPVTEPSTVLGAGHGNALCVVLSTAYESRWTFNKRLRLVSRCVRTNNGNLLTRVHEDRTSHRQKRASALSRAVRPEEDIGLVSGLRVLHVLCRR